MPFQRPSLPFLSQLLPLRGVALDAYVPTVEPPTPTTTAWPSSQLLPAAQKKNKGLAGADYAETSKVKVIGGHDYDYDDDGSGSGGMLVDVNALLLTGLRYLEEEGWCGGGGGGGRGVGGSGRNAVADGRRRSTQRCGDSVDVGGAPMRVIGVPPSKDAPIAIHRNVVSSGAEAEGCTPPVVPLVEDTECEGDALFSSFSSFSSSSLCSVVLTAEGAEVASLSQSPPPQSSPRRYLSVADVLEVIDTTAAALPLVAGRGNAKGNAQQQKVAGLLRDIRLLIAATGSVDGTNKADSAASANAVCTAGSRHRRATATASALGSTVATPLHMAAQHDGLAVVVEALLRAGANGNALAKGVLGGGGGDDSATAMMVTPLHVACYFGNVAVVKALIHTHADHHTWTDRAGGARTLPVNVSIDAVTSEGGYTALHLAAQRGHVDVVAALLLPALSSLLPLGGGSALSSSAPSSSSSVGGCGTASASAAAYASLWVADAAGWLPLHVAAQNGHAAVVAMLLDAAGAGAVPADDHHYDVPDGEEKRCDGPAAGTTTPCTVATMMARSAAAATDAVRRLANAPTTAIHASGGGGARTTALWLAAIAGHAAVVEVLVAKGGADLNAVSTSDASSSSASTCAAAATAPTKSTHTHTQHMQNSSSTALYAAAQAGHAAVVAALLRCGPPTAATAATTTATAATATAIRCAAASPIVPVMAAAAVCDVNALSSDGFSALHAAASAGHAAVVQLLLACGRATHTIGATTALSIDVNVKASAARGCCTPLYLAAQNGHADVVRLLLAAKAKTRRHTRGSCGGFTALHAAALGGHVAVVAALMEAGADANAKTIAADVHTFAGTSADSTATTTSSSAHHGLGGGLTALHLAALKGHTNIAKALLRIGLPPPADSSSPRREEKAEPKRKKSSTNALIVPAYMNAVDERGRTPLYLAALKGRVGIVNLLLSASSSFSPINVNAKTKEGATALHAASRGGHTEVVKALLCRPQRTSPATMMMADASAADSDGLTALHLAARNGHTAVVEALLTAATDGSDAANALRPHPLLALALVTTKKEGYTALHCAAFAGHASVVKVILHHLGAVGDGDVVGEEEERGSGTTKAKEKEKRSPRCALLTAAARKDGATALHLAVRYGHAAVVKALLQCECAMLSGTNTCTYVSSSSSSSSPSSPSSPRGATSCPRRCSCGAALLASAPSNDGVTALHVAAVKGRADVVEALLLHCYSSARSHFPSSSSSSTHSSSFSSNSRNADDDGDDASTTTFTTTPMSADPTPTATAPRAGLPHTPSSSSSSSAFVNAADRGGATPLSLALHMGPLMECEQIVALLRAAGATCKAAM